MFSVSRLRCKSVQFFGREVEFSGSLFAVPEFRRVLCSDYCLWFGFGRSSLFEALEVTLRCLVLVLAEPERFLIVVVNFLEVRLCCSLFLASGIHWIG